MRTRLLVAILVVALVVTAVIVVTAAPRGRAAVGAPPAGGPGMGPGAGCPMGMGMGMGFGPRLAKELGLTQDQITQLKGLHDEFLTNTKTTREQLQAKCKQMCDLWAAAQPDPGQIKALAADMDALRAEIRDTGIDYMFRGLNVLTAEQREKLQGMVKNWGGKCMGMGCGLGMGPGMGCGLGMGPGAGPGMGRGRGCGMGAGCPMGTGPGWGNATGPRAQMGTCPKLAK